MAAQLQLSLDAVLAAYGSKEGKERLRAMQLAHQFIDEQNSTADDAGQLLEVLKPALSDSNPVRIPASSETRHFCVRFESIQRTYLATFLCLVFIAHDCFEMSPLHQVARVC
eukprot:6112269-Pleurochrysis_carterae.AAC.3